MTHDMFRLDSEVRNLLAKYEHATERIAWLEDRVATLLSGAGEPVTRLPSRPVKEACFSGGATVTPERMEKTNIGGRMTPERIAELRALVDKATPGPIAIHRIDLDGGALEWQMQSERRNAAVVGSFTDEDNRRARYDAQLFSAAVDAIPELLDEVERLRKMVAMLEHAQVMKAGKMWSP